MTIRCLTRYQLYRTGIADESRITTWKVIADQMHYSYDDIFMSYKKPNGVVMYFKDGTRRYFTWGY